MLVTCIHCLEEKEEEEFIRIRKNHKNTYRKECKNCRSKDLVQRLHVCKSFYQEIKAKTPCTDCGNKYPYYVMDFDHIAGKKVANISAIRTLSVLKRELKKCEVVCSNCHRTRTFSRERNKVDTEI